MKNVGRRWEYCSRRGRGWGATLIIESVAASELLLAPRSGGTRIQRYVGFCEEFFAANPVARTRSRICLHLWSAFAPGPLLVRMQEEELLSAVPVDVVALPDMPGKGGGDRFQCHVAGLAGVRVFATAAHLRDQGLTIPQIVQATGITRSSLYRHLPLRPPETLTAENQQNA